MTTEMTEPTTARPIDGRALADAVLVKAQAAAASLPRRPGLVAILVGDDAPSKQYVANKRRAAERVGITFRLEQRRSTVRRIELFGLIAGLNRDREIDAVIVQLPLPAVFNPTDVINRLRLDKDVDGFHPENIKALIRYQSAPMPPLLKAILTALKATDAALDGKRAIVIARSEAFCRPLFWMLRCHRLMVEGVLPDSNDLAIKARTADVLISFCGRPHSITSSMVKPGAVVIDGGMTRVDTGQWVGDVAPDVSNIASWLTPAPGGIGPLAVALMMENTVQLSAEHQSNRR